MRVQIKFVSNIKTGRICCIMQHRTGNKTPLIILTEQNSMKMLHGIYKHPQNQGMDKNGEKQQYDKKQSK